MSDKTIRISYRREVIRALPQRIEAQYPPEKDADRWFGTDKTVAGMKMGVAGLDLDRCSVADVRAIGLGESWVDHQCDICERQSEVLVCVGDLSGGYETRFVRLCWEDATKAASMAVAAAEASARWPTR